MPGSSPTPSFERQQSHALEPAGRELSKSLRKGTAKLTKKACDRGVIDVKAVARDEFVQAGTMPLAWKVSGRRWQHEE